MTDGFHASIYKAFGPGELEAMLAQPSVRIHGGHYG
jgi:hypothetical protein